MKKPLKLSDVRKPLKIEVNRGMSMHYLSRLLEGRYNITIDFDVYLPTKGKNLQRPFVWTLHQKQELVLSLIKGIRIPNLTILIYEIGHIHQPDHRKIYKIIDGKQRLGTLLSFMKNEFPISWNGEEYLYNELDKSIQDEFRLYTILADVGYEDDYARISDDDLIQWFELINFSGTPQDKEHLESLKK